MPQNWKGAADEHLAHQRRVVVIAREAVDGQAEVAQQLLEALVARAGLVLDEVARGEDQVGPPGTGQRVGQRRHQRVVRVHAPHPRLALRVQVRVGDVEYAQGRVPRRDYNGRASRAANGFRRRRGARRRAPGLCDDGRVIRRASGR